MMYISLPRYNYIFVTVANVLCSTFFSFISGDGRRSGMDLLKVTLKSMAERIRWRLLLCERGRCVPINYTVRGM